MKKLHFLYIMLYDFKSNKRMICDKNTFRKFIWTPALWVVKKWFGKFRQVDSYINDQLFSWWPSNVGEVALLPKLKYKPKNLTAEIAKSLKIDNSTGFRHLRDLGSRKRRILTNMKGVIWNHANAKPCRILKIWNGKLSITLFTWALCIYICFDFYGTI